MYIVLEKTVRLCSSSQIFQ